MAFVLSMFMRGHFGGYMNVLIPGIWSVALWVGLAGGAVLRRWPSLPLRAVIAVGLAAQIWTEGWSIERFAPTEADRLAGDQVVEVLAAVDGPVLAPQFPWYPVLAGKEPAFHLIALWDIDRDGGPLQDDAISVSHSIRDRRWAGVLVDKRGKLGARLNRVLKRHYTKGENLTLPKGGLTLKTGWKVRPRTLYRPNEKASSEDSMDSSSDN
jgi:hypothetical protein